MATYDNQEFYNPEEYKENQTNIMELRLLGFQNSYILKVPLFSLLLLSYSATIVGNILIIVLISTSKNLHCPMYFFLQHLSMSDILLTTNITPWTLHILTNDGATMSLAGCLTQYFFFSNSEAFECFLLTVMSYDRYLAICNPLHYSSIMNHQICIILVTMCWILACALAGAFTIALSLLHFCRQITIDHFFCDPSPLLELSCSDTFFVQMAIISMVVTVVIIPFLFIIVSYVCIAFAIQAISSNTRRQKAFSTCSSHLAVVGMFYGTLFGMYIDPNRTYSSTTKKLLSLLYTVVTPLLNPIIYSMRSKDMKQALGKHVSNSY